MRDRFCWRAWRVESVSRVSRGDMASKSALALVLVLVLGSMSSSLGVVVI